MTRCEITELPDDMCDHCRQPHWPRAREKQPAGRAGPTVEARHPGRCMACGERYTAGTAITYDAATDGWICEDCADEEGQP